VRALDRAHGLGDEGAHRLALRALDFTAHALASLVPSVSVIERPADGAIVWNQGRTPVLAPRGFLDDDEQAALDPLPHSWGVTSDSIAARVAERLGARTLYLLKSASLPASSTLGDAVRLGLVDPVFPTAAKRLERVHYLNFRAPPSEPLRLLTIHGPAGENSDREHP
jgi:hypothetical protein